MNTYNDRRNVGILIVFSMLILTGCSGEKYPANFPKLVPCSIVLNQEGKPAADIEIRLVAKDGNCPWVISGKTDTNGTALLVTHGKYKGVPTGKYAVILKKQEIENFEKITNGLEESSVPPKAKIFSLIELKYTKLDTTPLETNIEHKVKVEFDIGPAVRIVTGNMSDA